MTQSTIELYDKMESFWTKRLLLLGAILYAIITYCYPQSGVRVELAAITDDSIYINIINETKEKRYIFDSYFPYADRQELYRYTDSLGTVKLCFEPFHDCLAHYCDRINLDNPLLCFGCLQYHFITLKPASTEIIALSKSCLDRKEFFKDFDAKSLFWYPPQFSSQKTIEIEELTIVFAIYHNVKNINRKWITKQEHRAKDWEDHLKVFYYITDYETCSIKLRRPSL